MYQFPYPPFFMAGPQQQPTAPQKPPSLKKMLKYRDEIEKLIESELKRRDEIKKKDAPPKKEYKPPSFSFLETLVLVIGLSPLIVGLELIFAWPYISPYLTK